MLHTIPGFVPTPALVPAEYTASPFHKGYKKFDASLLIKNIIYGSVKVILPFLFCSDQTRLDFDKLYAYQPVFYFTVSTNPTKDYTSQLSFLCRDV